MCHFIVWLLHPFIKLAAYIGAAYKLEKSFALNKIVQRRYPDLEDQIGLTLEMRAISQACP